MFARNRTPENWELKRKWRNLATRERRRAVKEYWALKTDEFSQKPRDFYKAFKPFLSNKTKEDTRIAIKVDENIITNPNVVADVLCDHFSTAANDIGGAHVHNLTELDFTTEPPECRGHSTSLPPPSI